MPTDVKLPRLGQGMESGVIVRWLKAPGDAVRKGEPLYELDTDKVTQEVEAELDGVLLEIRVAEGDVEVGTTVAVIGAEGDGNGAGGATPATTEPQATEAVGEAPDNAAAEAPPPVEEPVATVQPSERAPSVVPRGEGRVKASPLARRIARERGIDLATVVATGPEGRILAEDVEQAAAGGPTVAATATAPPSREVSVAADPDAIEVVQLTSIRKTIARRLSEAWTAPVFQLGVSVDMTAALALREALVARMDDGDAKPTVNDLLVKLSAVALTRHTAVNALFTGDEIQRYAAAHVGIAVAAPQGLVVPVIRNADRLTVQQIARARVDLVGRSRDNKLTLPDLQGGTFTISNLGMFGVEQFTAVLNPPQVAILAVGAVTEQVVVAAGEITARPTLALTLTCDHRAIDGADGAQFLQTLVALVEQPALAL